MEYTPMLAPIEMVKNMIRIQRVGVLRMPCIISQRGGSPLLSPPRPRSRKRNPVSTDRTPRTASAPRQGKNRINPSAIRGAVM